MIPITFGEIAKIVNGELLNLAPDTSTSASPVIDSRKARKGTFFAAFVGENLNGHDFVEAAMKNGAEFALVSKRVDCEAILVQDVQEALATLAREVRKRLKSLTTIGITGSQGKTTTKDLLGHILSTYGQVVSPEESLNNELGVPLLILRCTEETKYCIVEMGARHEGDIAYLSEIAKPNVGLVLSVGKAHLGEFGSREVIAKTKSELIRGLGIEGIAVLGSYDEFTPKMADGLNLKVISFGETSACKVRAADIEVREGRAHFDLVTPEGRTPVSLQLLGLHQIANALGAAAVSTALGIPLESIAAALSTAEVSSKWRMEMIEKNELLIINDSYNANPESMAAALRTLALIAQERGGVSWAFLGKMHELGASSEAEHQAIGRLATEIGIDQIVSIGTKEFVSDLAAEEISEGESQLHFFPNREAALSMIPNFAKGDVVLVKASRAEEFNLLVDEIVLGWEALAK